MTTSSVLVSGWVNGTTPVTLTGSEHVYNITGLTAIAAGVNGPYGTSLIIKDASGNTLMSVPLAIAPSLINLGPFSGVACDVPDVTLTEGIVNTPFTAQLSANLATGQIGILLGTNKAN